MWRHVELTSRQSVVMWFEIVVALVVTVVIAFIVVWGMGEVADWMVR